MNKMLHQLMIQDIQDLYSGEEQIIEALPKLIEKTTDPMLKQAFQTHLEETQEQSKIMEQICETLSIDPQGKKCIGMEGIIKEGDEIIKDMQPSYELDLALIAAAQKVEHYEIAGYGTAVNYAQEMGHTEIQQMLHDILEEEKTTDERLTQIAEQIIKNKIKHEVTEPMTS